ncbi:MAG: hypothetical protein KDK78_05920, partial [Chlamydiia bacterium]|nr:hypothetical protein [Chlamydiia bacterium]
MQAALIDRDHAAPPLELTAPDRIPPPSYAWDKKTPWPVTQHFFRCRGSALHPAFTLYPDGEDPISYLDCDGLDSHGLPAREGKEFIYPILI